MIKTQNGEDNSMEKTHKKDQNYSGSDFLNHSWEYSGFLTIIGLSDHGSLWPRKLAQNSNEGHNMSLGQKFLSQKFFGQNLSNI